MYISAVNIIYDYLDGSKNTFLMKSLRKLMLFKYNALLVADKVLRNGENGRYDDERNCRAGSLGA